MKHRFLHRNNSSKCLVFFNGWGMDDNLFAGWEPGGFDVLTVCDYTTLEPLPDLAGYKELHLAAWSLGVWAAARVAKGDFITATAFNGTLRPVDAKFGIAPEIFAGTIANWNEERARERFFARVGKDWNRPARSWESQQAELAAIETAAADPVPANPFKLALIGTRDRIIPPESQRRFWQGVKTEEVDAPHYPFEHIASFAEIVEIGR